jgi:hypothetical protein
MTEHPLCQGCGKRMSVEDEETSTHPMPECYRQLIDKQRREIEKLKEYNNELRGLRWFIQYIDNITDMETFIAGFKKTGLHRIWELVDQGWLTFDWEWQIKVHPDVIKAREEWEKKNE